MSDLRPAGTTSPGPHIVTSDDVRGGRPRLAATRLTVADVVVMHLRLGQSVTEIAATYALSLAAVHAALAYYYDHQAEIDAGIRDDEAFAEAFERSNPSPLRDKLNSLSGG
jgi:uncharacterized protein (DUF433 family)